MSRLQKTSGATASASRALKLRKLQKDALKTITALQQEGYSAALLVLDDSAAAASGSLHVVKPESRLGSVVMDDDFPQYLDAMMGLYTPTGMRLFMSVILTDVFCRCIGKLLRCKSLFDSASGAV